MKILITTIGFRPQIGGLETHLDDLCEHLRRHGHQIYVITYQPLMTRIKAPRRETLEYLDIYRLPWFGYNWFHRLEVYPPLLFLYLFPGLFIGTLFFLLKHRDIEVIHAHGTIAAVATKVMARLFRKRTVMSTHTIYGLETRPLLTRFTRWALASFDAVLALSPLSRDELLAIGLPEEKVRVYIHWINLGRFYPHDTEKCKRELQLENRFVVLFLGRLIEKKGAGVLLEAARLTPNITYAFAGDGPMAKEIALEAEKRENVIYFGEIPNEDAPGYYCAADVFAIPSQYEEGFGRVLAEAMACGTPVLAANRGSLPQLVPPEVGFITEPAAAAIAAVLKSLLEDRGRLLKMRVACRDYAVEHFSERNAETILASYRGLR